MDSFSLSDKITSTLLRNRMSDLLLWNLYMKIIFKISMLPGVNSSHHCYCVQKADTLQTRTLRN